MTFCADKCLCGSSVFTLVPSKRELKYALAVGAVCSNPTQRECQFICLFIFLFFLFFVCCCYYLFIYLLINHSLTCSPYTTSRK